MKGDAGDRRVGNADGTAASLPRWPIRRSRIGARTIERKNWVQAAGRAAIHKNREASPLDGRRQNHNSESKLKRGQCRRTGIAGSVTAEKSRHGRMRDSAHGFGDDIRIENDPKSTGRSIRSDR